MNLSKKRVSRRKALSTAGKVAISAIVAGVVAGVGGYYVGSTGAVGGVVAPARRIKLTLACDAGHNYLPWFDPDEAPEGGHYGQNQAPKIADALGIEIEGEEVDPGTEFSIYMADLTGPGKYNIIVYFPTYNGDILGGGWAVPLDPFIEKYKVNLADLPPVYRYPVSYTHLTLPTN